jgi:hypothetical protein
MSDDFLSQIHSFDRVEIPAVSVPEGAKLDQTATQMGLQDPVEIPVQFGDGDASAFGDRFTENVTGVFQPDTPEDEDGFRDATDVLNELADVRKSPPRLKVRPSGMPGVVNRPAGPRGKSFAPVRQRLQDDE